MNRKSLKAMIRHLRQLPLQMSRETAVYGLPRLGLEEATVPDFKLKDEVFFYRSFCKEAKLRIRRFKECKSEEHFEMAQTCIYDVKTEYDDMLRRAPSDEVRQWLVRKLDYKLRRLQTSLDRTAAELGFEMPDEAIMLAPYSGNPNFYG